MKTVPLSEAKAHLSRLVDEVEGRDEEVVITRNGRAAAVLVSPSDLESLKETAAVRSDTALVAEIRRGLSALKRGRAKLYTLDALLED
ncbi:type II toxin-antitoxin system Phd/YefM family antitoxin [Candidatus Binatia bacterium]|jgi:prevent-host-death family protein|nr:type II toxin-antitoxin system Phd/YefM family antitoxin [Candidatus Binatia bacterium]